MGTGTTALARHRTTPPNVALLQRDKRLASLLNGLASGVPVNVPEDIRQALPALVADAEAQLQPLSLEEMQGELTGLIAMMGAGVPQQEKTEFMAGAMIVLERFPAGLAREALHDALTEVDSLRKVLPHVKAYCEDYPDRFRRRLERLQDLHAHAEGRRHV